MLLESLNSWFAKFQKYFFRYKDGFFELSFLANSPQSMLASFEKMPFMDFDKVRKVFYPNTPFVKGQVHFEDLEEGFLVLNNDMHFKANVLFKMVYDKKIPKDYYFLSYNTSENDYMQSGSKINNISFSSRSWTIFKPGVNETAYHFKGTRQGNITLYFNEEWLNKNLLKDRDFTGSSFASFFKSKEQFIYWPDISKSPDIDMSKFKNLFSERDSEGNLNILKLKISALEMISVFMAKYENDKIESNYFEIPNNDRVRQLKIEKYLCENLTNSFMGIDFLATKFKISATKLKKDFKLLFGMTVFQYFQEKQMLLAKELFNTKDLRVKEVANILGYENQGKFSNAYKKQFDILPSEELFKD